MTTPDPLEAAIEAALDASVLAYDEVLNAKLGNPPGSVMGEGGRKALAEISAYRAAITAAVRAAASVIAAPIERERDEALASLTALQPLAQVEVLRARLAVIEKQRDLATDQAQKNGAALTAAEAERDHLRTLVADVSDAHHEGFGAGVEWADRYGDLVHHARDLRARLSAYEDVVAAARACVAGFGPVADPQRNAWLKDETKALIAAVRALSTDAPPTDTEVTMTDTGALEAAIEAAWVAFKAAKRPMPPYTRLASQREAVEDAVRAAAPLIEREALERAADELDRLSATDGPGRRRLASAEWLRGRAPAVTGDD